MDRSVTVVTSLVTEVDLLHLSFFQQWHCNRILATDSDLSVTRVTVFDTTVDLSWWWHCDIVTGLDLSVPLVCSRWYLGSVNQTPSLCTERGMTVWPLHIARLEAKRPRSRCKVSYFETSAPSTLYLCTCCKDSVTVHSICVMHMRVIILFAYVWVGVGISILYVDF